MEKVKTDHHEAIDWTDEQIHLRLGEITLNLGELEPLSGERRAADKEIDCLTFEMSCREGN